jgi:hypothetical protein
MSDVTLYIAQILGPITLVIGIGILANPGYYRRLYKNLEEHGLVLLISAIAGIAVGLAIVLSHNAWNTTPEILVSLLGWIILIKGVVLAVFPKTIEGLAASLARIKGLFTIAAAIYLVLGGYLTYVAYF